MKRISNTATELAPIPSKNGHAPPAGYVPPGPAPETMRKIKEQEQQASAEKERIMAVDAEKLRRAKAREEDENLAKGITMPALSRCGDPQHKQKVLWVEKLKGATKGRYILYSEWFWGYQTHYNGKKNVLCFEDHDLCIGGHKKATLRDNYMLHCYSYQRKRQVFLYLTPGAALQLKEQLEPGQSLRGLTVTITRTNSDKGRYEVVIEGTFANLEKIPAPMDPRDTINNLYVIDDADKRSMSHLSPGPDEPEEPEKGESVP